MPFDRKPYDRLMALMGFVDGEVSTAKLSDILSGNAGARRPPPTDTDELVNWAADEIERLRALCHSAGLNPDPPQNWHERHGWDDVG